MECFLPHEFDRQAGRANERAQNPGQLTAEKEITGQPREEDPVSDCWIPAESAEKLDEPKIGCHACERDDYHLQ